jgi:hypothetical protein
MLRLGCASLLSLALSSIACGDSGTEPVGGGGTGGADAGGAGGGASAQTCEAVLTFLQKDAYKETAGRTSSLWPPHTTTTFEISCDGEVVSSAFMANHGTEPDAVDANGDLFLEPQGSATIEGSRADLEALSAAYSACECDTQFLSMDALSDSVVQELVGNITSYVVANLTCTGPITAEDVATMLSEGDIEGVLAALPDCSWANGTDWDTGLDQALQAIIAAANETLAEYHVCNNDAMLQAELIDGFAASGVVGVCGPASPLCRGPAWYFEP